MVHFTLLNLTLPNLTKPNSTEISDSDFSDTEIFHETSEPSEGEIITLGENLEIQNVPPAEKLTIPSTIKLVKQLVESHWMVYASHHEEAKYSNAINRWKDFWENAERFGKDRIEFLEFILQCSDKSKFWSKKLNNCREIYTHYAKVVNEVWKEIRNAEKDNLTVFY